MKKMALVLAPAVALAWWGCASLTPDGAKVKVYQANVTAEDEPAPPLPAGCRLLGTSGPIDQQQEAREQSDPYLIQRNSTAAAGGNVLYLRSFRFRNLMKTDCAVADKTPGCMDQLQNWYKVTFYSYSCDAAAVSELDSVPDRVITVPYPGFFGGKKTPTPVPPAASEPRPAAAAPPPAPAPTAVPPRPASSASVLKTKILALMQEGVGADVIRAYVRANPLEAPLTAEEIIDWKKSGISDAVIEATFSK